MRLASFANKFNNQPDIFRWGDDFVALKYTCSGKTPKIISKNLIYGDTWLHIGCPLTDQESESLYPMLDKADRPKSIDMQIGDIGVNLRGMAYTYNITGATSVRNLAGEGCIIVPTLPPAPDAEFDYSISSDHIPSEAHQCGLREDGVIGFTVSPRWHENHRFGLDFNLEQGFNKQPGITFAFNCRDSEGRFWTPMLLEKAGYGQYFGQF